MDEAAEEVCHTSFFRTLPPARIQTEGVFRLGWEGIAFLSFRDSTSKNLPSRWVPKLVQYVFLMPYLNFASVLRHSFAHFSLTNISTTLRRKMNGRVDLDSLMRQVRCYRNVARVRADVIACIAQVATLPCFSFSRRLMQRDVI